MYKKNISCYILSSEGGQEMAHLTPKVKEGDRVKGSKQYGVVG